MHRMLRGLCLVLALGGVLSAQPQYRSGIELATAGVSLMSAEPAANTPEVDAILARAAAYVVRFDLELASVVVEERYVQLAKPWQGSPISPDQEPALNWDPAGRTKTRSPIITSRRLRSDVLLVQMPDGMALGYRDVFEVDGKAIKNRDERVRKLFLSGTRSSREQLRRINSESSRYNLGTATRTINTPNFPLIYIHPRVQPGVHYEAKGFDVVDGVRCAVLEYREDRVPAVVGTSTGGDILARGRFWIEPATGRVHRAEVLLGGAMVQVTYAEQAGVSVLVPRQMWELYYGAAAALLQTPVGGVHSGGTGNAYIECLATYDNIRRFTVTTTEQVKDKR